MWFELLNGEIFYTLKEVSIIIEAWRCQYNTIRPHSSLRYWLPAPEALLGPAAQPGPDSPPSRHFTLCRRCTNIQSVSLSGAGQFTHVFNYFSVERLILIASRGLAIMAIALVYDEQFINVAKILVKFIVLICDSSDYIVERYSEKNESVQQ
jgi:hypothetical protein